MKKKYLLRTGGLTRAKMSGLLPRLLALILIFAMLINGVVFASPESGAVCAHEHTSGGGCFASPQEHPCTEEEGCILLHPAHAHDELCWAEAEAPVLICQEADVAHVHEDALCYAPQDVPALICGLV